MERERERGWGGGKPVGRREDDGGVGVGVNR